MPEDPKPAADGGVPFDATQWYVVKQGDTLS